MESTVAAYASLLSLGHILDQLLQHPPHQMALLDNAQIVSLLENITFLQDFLEDFSLLEGDEIQALEAKIARSSYAAEDIIEKRAVDQVLENTEAGSESSSTLSCQDLWKLIEEFDSMKKDALKIKETEGMQIMEQPRKVLTAGSFIRGVSDSKNITVGFHEDLIQIRERLFGNKSNLQIYSIVGMGGIGKTTLAKNVFDHPLIVHHFDLRAWITISQQYSVRKILLGLLKDMGVPVRGGEGITEKTEEKLGLYLYKSLFNRRYFIVMDDMWSIEVWDAIQRFFPDNNNGSWVMVTTRLSNVADSFRSCTPHRLHFLDEDRSWVLFCVKVFGKESCPPELVELGKTIVRSCRGLPLAIFAISGLLAKSSRTVEYWKYVANDVYYSSFLPFRLFNDEHASLNMGGDRLCFKILSLSYKHLPLHLKPCFLYMAIFPEDHKIKISRLVKLWVAEGILKPIRSRSLEEIAEDNLKDLIDRNLIMIHEYGSRDKIKTCTIHRLLRDLCLREAQKEKFICVTNNRSKIINDKLWFIIHRNSDKETLKSTSAKLHKLLMLLNMVDTCSYEEIVRLVNCRLIDLGDIWVRSTFESLESLSLLWNLQTVTIPGTFSGFTAEIWEMPQLRHVKGEFYLPDPPSTNSENGGKDIFVLKNLQTLYKIRNFRCTNEVASRIPNLKKLGIIYSEFPSGFGWKYYEVYNLSHLRNLESLFLECVMKKLPVNICFPRCLKKLTLSHCGLCWEDLTVVSSLPHLEVLNLMDGAVGGRKWYPVEGEYRQLKSLRIEFTDLEEWIADSSHFPLLEKLQLRGLLRLKEIPYGIGQIPTLLSISLSLCSDSANSSAEKIQEEQQDLGNDDLKILLEEFREVSTIKDFGSIDESIGKAKQQKTPKPESSMVGFHEDVSRIKNWLTESKKHDQLEVMKIVGAAGTGKTTLARNLFDQADLDYKFGIYVWISVSRTSNVQKMIRGILDSMRPKEDELDNKSIEQLTDILYKSLKGKRYLVVLDDLWDIQVWDNIKRSFPDDNRRSRIILTTRLFDIDLGVRSSQVHHMTLLGPEMSQTLFLTKVFGKEKFPRNLYYAARHILGNCSGLPLAIVVIGGLLSKVSRTTDDWLLILETMVSTITSKGHLKGILSLGYKYLPLNLRACFRSLLFSAEDHELPVPRLVRLWIDEGLVDKTGSKNPEEVAENFLKDLIDRSLIMVCKQNKKGEVETCGIPSIWQDYFVANDPDILQILLSKSNQSTTPKVGMEDPSRSYSESVSIDEGRQGKINHGEEKEISMDMLFKNIYTKDCIRYCSLFPTTFEFTKHILVSLWTAQGETIVGNDAFIEETCIRCFDILLKVKYIVPTGYDPYGDQIKYKVGDEMNAFLHSHLIRPWYSKDLDNKHIEESKLKHLSLSFKKIGQIDFGMIKKLSRLQTLIIHGCYGFKVKNLPFDLFLELNSLRILSLSHTDVVELPSSIKSSKELRYLDMSETPIRWLPESMCNLTNLRTLKLDICLGLIRLPKRMKELINLHHLILDVARQLQSMPEGIGNLSELRTLRAFLVGEDDGYSINELKRMNKLSGSLRILKLENIRTPDQAANASLCSKQGLKKIELQWSDFQDEKNQNEEDILTCLEPPLSIQELKILYYSGGKLPNWISKPSFTELISLTLHKCKYCSNLPSLGQLPSLKFLSIIGMNQVLEINNLFCREQGTNQNQSSFPVLEKLSFDSMSKLEKWTEIRVGDFPLLMNLIIESCPKINCLPSLSHLNSLMHLELSYCPELACLPDGGLPLTLESLMIKDCPKLNERCSNNQGEDWSKIDHVPILYIDNMEVHKK